MDKRALPRLLALFFQFPLGAVCGAWTTVTVYKKASIRFPEKHAKDGPENAFRHALWSGSLYITVLKLYPAEKARRFAWLATETHECLFPNPDPQRIMDLHNNKCGILYTDLLLADAEPVSRFYFEHFCLRQMKYARPLKMSGENNPYILVYLKS